MEDNSIVRYINYGYIKNNIPKVMKDKKISKTELVKKTGLHHQIIERYAEDKITRIDLDILAKLCYVLNSKVEELIEYER